MDHDNRRQAVRIDCTLPLRLEGAETQVDASLLDLSRTGLRLRIPGAILGVHRLSSLVQVTRRLQAVLGDAFDAQLHPDVLGPLISRSLTPTRIAKRDWEGTDVEVGCVLDRPLTDEEVGMLGVALPRIGAQIATPDLHGNEPTVRGPRINRDPANPPTPAHGAAPDSFPAYIYPAPGKSTGPLGTHTRSLSRGLAVLDVDRNQDWAGSKMDVASVVVALDNAYGSQVMMRIVDEQEDLWAGPAEIKEVEVPPGPERVKLGVAFGREMDTRDLRRLGLPRPA